MPHLECILEGVHPLLQGRTSASPHVALFNPPLSHTHSSGSQGGPGWRGS